MTSVDNMLSLDSEIRVATATSFIVVGLTFNTWRVLGASVPSAIIHAIWFPDTEQSRVLERFAPAQTYSTPWGCRSATLSPSEATAMEYHNTSKASQPKHEATYQVTIKKR